MSKRTERAILARETRKAPKEVEQPKRRRRLAHGAEYRVTETQERATEDADG